MWKNSKQSQLTLNLFLGLGGLVCAGLFFNAAGWYFLLLVIWGGAIILARLLDYQHRDDTDW